MTIFFGEESTPEFNAVPARGVATIWQNHVRSAEATRLAGNINSAGVAFDRAERARLEAISEALNVKIANIDERVAEKDQFYRPVDRGGLNHVSMLKIEANDELHEELATLQEKNPEFTDVIKADVRLEDDAKQLAREAEENFEIAFRSRGGIGKYFAAITGGFEGMLNDPFNVATLAAGTGPATARTSMGRITQVATREAALNSAIEAASQPAVQQWRKEVGLSHGFDEALFNILLAAGFGGTIGGSAKTAQEALRTVSNNKALKKQLDDAIEQADLPEETRKALMGEVEAATSFLNGIRGRSTSYVRGVYDALEQRKHIVDQSPDSISAKAHARAVDNATDFLNRKTDTIPVDEGRVYQIARQVAEAQPSTDPIDFVAQLGGIKARAPQIEPNFQTHLDDAFTPNGVTPEKARTELIENGFFDRQFKSREEAREKVRLTQVEDLLIDTAEGKNAAARAGVTPVIRELIEHAGPGVDSKLLAKAYEIATEQAQPPREALVRAADEIGLSKQQRAALDGVDGNATMLDDMVEPMPSRNEPAEDVEILSPEEIETAQVPNENGELIPLTEVLEDADRELGIANLVAGCRV